MIDPLEKERLFEVTIAGNKQLLSVIARNNAPINDWLDLKQEIQLAFWKSLDSYDGESSGLRTWLFSVAKHTSKNFSYAEISSALGVDEVNLRKRMSRIKEQLKAQYQESKNGTR